MNCPECGAKLVENLNFCPKCGRAIEKGDGVVPPPKKPRPTEKTPAPPEPPPVPPESESDNPPTKKGPIPGHRSFYFPSEDVTVEVSPTGLVFCIEGDRDTIPYSNISRVTHLGKETGREALRICLIAGDNLRFPLKTTEESVAGKRLALIIQKNINPVDNIQYPTCYWALILQACSWIIIVGGVASTIVILVSSAQNTYGAIKFLTFISALGSLLGSFFLGSLGMCIAKVAEGRFGR